MIAIEFEKLLLEREIDALKEFLGRHSSDLRKILVTDLLLAATNPRKIFAITRFYLEIGEHDMARDCLIAMTRQWPNVTQFRLYLAKTLFGLGHRAAAAREMKRYCVQSSLGSLEESIGSQLLGFETKRSNGDAQIWILAMTKLHPSLQLAILENELSGEDGKPSLALDDDWLQNPDVRRELRQLVKIELLPVIANLALVLSWGRKLTEIGDAIAASNCFDLLRQGWPLNTIILLEAARAKSMLGALDEAANILRLCLVSGPSATVAAKNLASLLADGGKQTESRRQYEIVLTLQPEHAMSKRAISELDVLIGASDEKSGNVKPSRWPRHVSQMEDFEHSIKKFVTSDVPREKILAPGSSIFTMGSCFARNLAEVLTKKYPSMDVSFLYADEDINNTYAGRYIIDYLSNNNSPHVDVVESYFELDYLNNLRNKLRSTDVVVYTMGVAPGFFDPLSGEYVIPVTKNIKTRDLIRSYKFRSTSVEENVENIKQIIHGLRSFNSEVRIVLTVSPVPIGVSFEFGSPVVADCLSKSTLRVAAQEIVRQFSPQIFYWPSFEIVRWLAPQYGQVFGVDDGQARHISKSVIEKVVDTFVSHLGSVDLVPPNSKV